MLWILEGVRLTADYTVDVIEKLCVLMSTFKRLMRELDAKVYSQDLLNNVFKYPYTKVGFAMKDLSVSRPTATRYLNILVDGELLVEQKIGKDNFYINVELLQLLTRPSSAVAVAQVESVEVSYGGPNVEAASSTFSDEMGGAKCASRTWHRYYLTCGI